MKAINIKWDVDFEEDLEMLPTEIEIPNEMKDEEEISDYITDKFEFCHCGFELVEEKGDKAMKVLNEEMMTGREYHEYVMEECERQWNECQKEEYGEWHLQSDDTKADYYNDMYEHLADNLGKACCDCCYLGEKNGRFYCNFGDSECYGKEVQARNYCDEFESL